MKDGVLNINKPQGMTSFAVVAGLRKILKIRKIGHAGTLDPEAEGVLPVCLGKATKIIPFLMDETKEYRAVLHFGVTTNTQDATGIILEERENIILSQKQIMGTLNSFVGEIEQIPPMFSALKFKGKRLYELAREGIEVARNPRKVKIHGLILHRYEAPYLTFDVSCSKGTYIRTLCADIGQNLGVGGHMASLQRLRVGGLTIDEALPFDLIRKDNALEILNTRIHSMDEMLRSLPIVQVKVEAERKVYHGQSLLSAEVLKYPDDFHKGDVFRGHNQRGELLGIFEAMANSEELYGSEPNNFWFKPKRLLA